jgi:hypothetical protein
MSDDPKKVTVEVSDCLLETCVEMARSSEFPQSDEAVDFFHLNFDLIEPPPAPSAGTGKSTTILSTTLKHARGAGASPEMGGPTHASIPRGAGTGRTSDRRAGGEDAF